MIEEARGFAADAKLSSRSIRIGVTSGLNPLPTWKREADFLFVQVSFALDALLGWRSSVPFEGPVFAGVMAPPSAAMARKLTVEIPQLAVPDSLVKALDHNRDAGVEFACEMVENIRASTAFDGVHLIPVTRYREIAARLEPR